MKTKRSFLSLLCLLLALLLVTSCGARIPDSGDASNGDAAQSGTEQGNGATENAPAPAPSPAPEHQPTEQESFLAMSEAERARYLIAKISPEEICATETIMARYSANGTDFVVMQSGTLLDLLPREGEDGYYRYDRTLTLQENGVTTAVIEKKDGYFNQTVLYYRADGENQEALCAYLPEEAYRIFRNDLRFDVVLSADALTCTQTASGFTVTLAQMHKGVCAAILECLSGTWLMACQNVKDIVITIEADSALQILSVAMDLVYEQDGSSSFSYKKEFAPIDRNAAVVPDLAGYTYVASFDEIKAEYIKGNAPLITVADALAQAKSEESLSFSYDTMTKFYRDGRIHSFRTEEHELTLSALLSSPAFFTTCIINNASYEEIRKYEDGKLKTIRNGKQVNAETIEQDALIALIESYIDCGDFATMNPFFAYEADGVYTVRFVPDATALADMMRMVQTAVGAEDIIRIKGTAKYTVKDGKITAYHYQLEADFQKDEGTVGIIHRITATDFIAS